MSKTWLIIKHEYLHHVLNKRFLLALLGMPALLIVSSLFGILAVAIGSNNTPIGYVDQAGFIVEPAPVEEETFLEPPLPILKFGDEPAARAALDAGELQAYYVFPADYMASGVVRLVAPDPVTSRAQSDLIKLIRHNLLLQQPANVAERVLEGPLVEVRSSDQKQKLSSENWVAIILPIVAAVFLMIAVTSSGGYLLQALVDEKENRTIEMMLTSVSTNQLMIGKTIGNLSVGITPLLAWLLVGGLIAGFFIANLPAEFQLEFNWNLVWIIGLTFIPAFLMISAMMAAVGAIAAEPREGQQIAGLFTLPVMLPLMVLPALVENPNGAIAVTLSLIPFTAPMALPVRAAFTTVPAWQLILSIGLVWLLAVGALWFAGRAFRLGMLRIGKRVRLREIFRKEAAQ